MIELASTYVSALFALVDVQEDELFLQRGAIDLLVNISRNPWPIRVANNHKLGVCRFYPQTAPFGGKLDVINQRKYLEISNNLLCMNLGEAGEGVGKKLGFFPVTMTSFTVASRECFEPKSDVKEIVREIFELYSRHIIFEDVRIVTKAEFQVFRNEVLRNDRLAGRRLKGLEKSLRSSFNHPLTFRSDPRTPIEKLLQVRE